jgi:beta-mannan synthase
MIMSVIVLAEKVFLGTVSSVMKLLRRRPWRMYRCDPIARTDEEDAGSEAYPMVLVQIPMYNEKEVYQLSIGAACRLTWPVDRLIVQVLDDSTDAVIKELVKSECERWAAEGINIRYETRKDRAGYKAGNLKEGMRHAYVRGCEFVAMFDADFQPAPDFLAKTVPFLLHNPSLALVQTRWKFAARSECQRLLSDENARDVHGLPLQGGAGSWLFPLQLLWLQRNRWSVEDTGDCRVRWLGGPNHC